MFLIFVTLSAERGFRNSKQQMGKFRVEWKSRLIKPLSQIWSSMAKSNCCSSKSSEFNPQHSWLEDHNHLFYSSSITSWPLWTPEHLRTQTHNHAHRDRHKQLNILKALSLHPVFSLAL